MLLTLELRHENDVVHARQRARRVSELLGLEAQDQTRVSTAVSELARNALRYAGGGRVELGVSATEPASLLVEITDRGPGIRDLAAIEAGTHRSKTGLGLGLQGARRLVDHFELATGPETGTTVLLGKRLPRGASTTDEALAHVADELARDRPEGLLDELQQQNQELLRALAELRTERERLAQVNRELEETNRGVVALYAELDERADYLQRATELKSKFLSNMTHELRTPLSSITSLTRILLQRLDGELTAEQERQVRFIQRSAESLSDLVDDLLDLAKVEAGKVVVRPSDLRTDELFGTLRGMLRPLLAQTSPVDLVFEHPVDLPVMHTDEAKVSQILRNFISNALKYTERGEVRVSARVGPGDTIVFEVADTGIGIAEEDQDLIFEEYAQLDNPLQQKARGTGLGLPLSRKLAGLLGGTVGVHSRVGVGSKFFAVLPRAIEGPVVVSFAPEVSRILDPTRLPVLAVEDNRESIFIYEKYLKGTGYQVLPAHTLDEARAWLRAMRPAAILLDILLESESSWHFITELREQPAYRDLPILVVTMVENEARALALGADAFRAKPVDREWLVASLDHLIRTRPSEKLLVIDEDEVSRYLLRGLLADTRFELVEAASAREGLLLAREVQPRAIFVDLVMQGADGASMLDALAADPRTCDIPVLIHTSKRLTEHDRARLHRASAILPKDGESRTAQLAALRQALAQAGLGEAGRKDLP
ncbi:ATP-binding protein [Myxococcota bacterium]|nr:ATP-binding protein [Myxococcota bacterium]